MLHDLFSYNRKEYQERLESLVHNGSYHDYTREVYHMNEAKKILNNKPIQNISAVQCCIDQAENVYWGDLFFKFDLSVKICDDTVTQGIEACISALKDIGVDAFESHFYFNRTLRGFMYTYVGIRCNEGPDLYKQGTRNFVIR